MNFKRAIFTLGGFTLLSRATGFLRDVMAANILGTGMAADAFFVALRLPNLFRRLFAEGAFTISFVPLFTTALKENETEAREFASQAMAILMAALIPFTVLMMLGMNPVMHLITPGYASDPVKFALAVDLARITFPYLMLISLAALLGSILNALGRFGPYAAAPIAFNIVQLLALFIWNSSEVEAATAQAWAVTVSGGVQLVWLIISAKRAGWVLKMYWPRFTPRIIKLLRLVGPGALGAGVMQVNIFIDMVLASKLPSGAVSYLSYADRMYQLPVGVIGIAIGTALLPSLSRTLREAGHTEAITEQNRAMEFGLYLGLPAAVFLALIPVPILATMYERGAFTSADSQMVAYAVMAYAIAVPAYMVSKVLTVAFYAREDTRSPFLISLRTVVVNTLSSICFMGAFIYFGHREIAFASLALATSLTAWLNVYLLARRLKEQGHFELDAIFRHKLPRLLLCAGGMAVVLFAAHWALSPAFSKGLLLRVVALGAMGGLAALVYFMLAHVTGVQRLDDLKRLLTRRRSDSSPPPMAPEP